MVKGFLTGCGIYTYIGTLLFIKKIRSDISTSYVPQESGRVLPFINDDGHAYSGCGFVDLFYL